ncbi:putative ALA-interacting subunit 2 [Quercus suber]|uniref:putative ALA-interacting subunit 2 n=1 Tax=Quercus suber TaxID=58331 RepID=UPI0032DFCCAF
MQNRSASTVERPDQPTRMPCWKSQAINKFTQQNLPACKPVLTPAWVILTFLLIGTIFIPIGLVSLHASRSVVEIVDRYDIDCVPEQFKSNKLGYIKDSSYPKNCSRTLKVMFFLFWCLPHSMTIPDLCASFSKFILQF